MHIIYNAIIDRIKAHSKLFTDNGMTPIRHFDIFKGQYLNPQLHDRYVKPALFYQWSAQWEDIGQLAQKGTITVQIHLELDVKAKSFHGSKDKDSALLYFDYQCYLNAILHGFGSDAFNPLRRRTDAPDENPQDTNVHIITYQTTIIDNTAQQIADSGYKMSQESELSIDKGSIRKTKKQTDNTQNKYII